MGFCCQFQGGLGKRGNATYCIWLCMILSQNIQTQNVYIYIEVWVWKPGPCVLSKISWSCLTHHSVVVCLLRRCRCKHRRQCLLGCQAYTKDTKDHISYQRTKHMFSIKFRYDTVQGFSNISPTFFGSFEGEFPFLFGGMCMDILGVFLHPFKIPKVNFSSLAYTLEN